MHCPWRIHCIVHDVVACVSYAHAKVWPSERKRHQRSKHTVSGAQTILWTRIRPPVALAFLSAFKPYWYMLTPRSGHQSVLCSQRAVMRPRLYVYVLARACVRCFWICRCFIHTRRNKSAAVMLVEQRCAFVRLYVFGVRKQSHSAYEIAPLPPLFSGRRVDFATPPPFPHTHTHFLREVERRRSKGGEGVSKQQPGVRCERRVENE